MDKIKILHPNTNKYHTLNQLSDYFSDGYYSIILDNEKKNLNYFLNSFEDYRTTYNDRIFDKNAYQNLPFSVNTIEWKERQKDVKIIEKHLKNKKELSILDIGSWNGWLSNYLAKKGHHLIAINMFTNQYDGLQSNKHYNTKFTSLQMISDEFYRIDKTFDVIIFNRNWAFFEDKQKAIEDAKLMLSKNGILLFTGLFFYRNSINIERKLTLNNANFKGKYKIPLFYKPSKGYLDTDDKNLIQKNKIKLIPYHPIKNFVKYFFSKKAKSYYGIFTKI